MSASLTMCYGIFPLPIASAITIVVKLLDFLISFWIVLLFLIFFFRSVFRNKPRITSLIPKCSDFCCGTALCSAELLISPVGFSVASFLCLVTISSEPVCKYL